MSKFIKVLVLLLILIISFLMIRSMFKDSDPPFRSDLVITPVHDIRNWSSIQYADTVLHIALEVLRLDKEITIFIHDMQPPHFRITPTQSGTLRGFVHVLSGKDYQIFLDSSLSRQVIIETLAHELIHIDQFRSGRLVELSNQEVLFRDQVYEVSSIDYEDRPWEREAFRHQRPIQRHILNRVYP